MPRAKRQHLKRRKDGRFACRYKDKWFMGATEEEALEAREEYIKREALGLSRCMTVAAYAAQWLPLYKSGVSDQTYNAYATHLDRLARRIGSKRLAEVTTDDAQAIFAELAGYSQSYIRKARMLYIAFFDAAQENGFATKNPFRSRLLQIEKGAEGSHRAITLEERNLILNTPHRFRLFALVMLYAGLRRGEAVCLSSDDIDGEYIHVRRAVHYEGNKPVIGNPKTEAGSRDIPVLPILADELAKVTGLIVTSAGGEMLTQVAFRRGWASYLHTLSEAAGHKVSIRPHDLRHSYCTMLRDAGVELKLAMVWLGHADEKMILHIYDHITDARIETALEQVEKIAPCRRNGRQK